LNGAKKTNSKLTQVELHLLEANLIWWKTISGFKDKKLKLRFFEVLDMAQKNLKKEKTNNLENHLKQLSIQGFRSRMAMLEQSYTSGFFQLNSSLNLFSKLLGKENENPLLLVYNGLYHYYWSKSWENYFLLRPYLILYPKGNLEKGIELLVKAGQSNISNIQTEAHYFLMKIWLEEKKTKKALFYAQILCKKYPKNAVFQYYQYQLLHQLGETAKATECENRMLLSLKNNTNLSQEQLDHFTQLCRKTNKAASL
jgi:predicted Zn-dependent protease